VILIAAIADKHEFVAAITLCLRRQIRQREAPLLEEIENLFGPATSGRCDAALKLYARSNAASFGRTQSEHRDAFPLPEIVIITANRPLNRLKKQRLPRSGSCRYGFATVHSEVLCIGIR